MDLVILLANFRDRGSEIDILVRKDQIIFFECVATFFLIFYNLFRGKKLENAKTYRGPKRHAKGSTFVNRISKPL